ncbi:cbb3-type cytochrome c oxidase subunit I, partial [Klebsiella pneumoniae]|nr:cbb3-type cytochrome c oxidase subunit I [Klebsiella pneumoniae]
FVTIGSVYYMIPRLFGKEQMHSTKLVEAHFWIATIGVVLYIAAMWIAGVMQGLMWSSLNDDGTLTSSFVESVNRTVPYYVIRFAGGLLDLSGMCIMAYNLY